MHPFREAIEAGDEAAALRLLADDVVFYSPVGYKPYRGRDEVSMVLRAVLTVFEDFRYVREIGTDDAALVFEARIGDRELTGADFIRLDRDGLISDFMVMVRPLNGLQALAEAMAKRLSAL